MSAPAALMHRHEESILIPAGPFHFGESGELIYLPPFRIDRYPVTVERYARFLAETGRRPPRDWTDSIGPRDRRTHPVVGVTFFDALAFARHLGRRLPTEEEWEKAARGTDRRIWPWGDRFNVKLLNSRGSRRRGTTEVDRHPGGASPFGVMDLSGNTWEWTESWFDSAVDLKVLKGGCHTLPKDHSRISNRHFNDPGFANNLTGFRTVEPL